IQGFAQKGVRTLVNRYKTRISRWEIWNEPNAWTSLDAQENPTGGSFLYPSNFAWLLKRSYAEIKAAQPGAASVVTAGSIFGHDPAGLATTVVQQGVVTHVIKRGHLTGTRLERGRSPIDSAVTAATSC